MQSAETKATGQRTSPTKVSDVLRAESAGDVSSGSKSQSLLTSAATGAGEIRERVDMTCEREAKEKMELEKSLNRRFYLPRLPAEAYRGYAVVHWTITMERRAKGWLSPAAHSMFREIMLHAQARQHLICPVYCMMPDHVHLVWMGLHKKSDQIAGMAFLRKHLEPLIAPVKFQHQAHDHVLREEERRHYVFETACNYIAANPVEADLVRSASDWEFTGAVAAGYPDLHPVRQAEFWRILWDVYGNKRQEDAI
jgi:REP element-mobilizing transposase RayT